MAGCSSARSVEQLQLQRTMMRAFAVLLATASLVAAGSAPLTLLQAPTARCLDGTQSGFYYQAATDASAANKWVVHLQGGGECSTQAACDAALGTALGSSKFFPPEVAMNAYLLNDDPRISEFAQWHHVLVPYCSQDLHTGQVTVPTNATFSLFFAGHLIYEAVLDALQAAHNLSAATDIILSGDSAGGIGVWPNLDYTALRFPSARCVGAPIAGFYFFAFPYTGPNATQSVLADFREAAWPQHARLWQSYVNRACFGALSQPGSVLDPSACLLAAYSFPYVRSESFVAEAQTDRVVLEAHDSVPHAFVLEPPEQAYIAAWAHNMTRALQPLLDVKNVRNGVFSPACYIHTDFQPKQPAIKGATFLQTFANFFFQRTDPRAYKLADNCGLWCNPTCPP